MSDIRNFFNVKTKNQPNSKNGPIKNRPKPLLSDSSDDDTIENTPERHVQLKNKTTKGNGQLNKRASKRRISGSSSDEGTSNETHKHTGSKKSKHTSAHPTNKTSSKNGTYLKDQTSNVEKNLKPVNATDFFKSSTANLKPIPKTKSPPKPENRKRKIDSDEIEEHDDPVFMAMLLDMDDKKEKPRPKRSPKAGTKEDNPKPEHKKAASNVGVSTVPSKEKSIAAKLTTKAKLENGTSKMNIQKKLDTTEYVPKPKNSPKKECSKTSIKTTADSNSKSSQSDAVSSQESSSQKETQSQVNIGNLARSENPSQLWVDKYKPTTTKGIIGQQSDKSNLKKLQAWLRGWEKHHGISASSKPPSRPPPWGASKDDGAWAKAVLLSGPPGVGKTTTSYLVAKEMGYEIMETNASDTRSKKSLDTEISDALSSKSVTSNKSKRLVLMALFKLHGKHASIKHVSV